MGISKLYKAIPSQLKDLGIIDPRELVKHLDEYVIGQHDAKRVLSIAAFQRSVRMLQENKDVNATSTNLKKNNVLLIGSTGSGKTYLVRTLAKILDCPITIYDITGTTSAGYVGGNIEDMLSTHLENTKQFILQKTAEMNDPEMKKIPIKDIWDYYSRLGILYIDEFDKCRKISDKGRDINGEAVQQALLKVLEDGMVSFTDREDKKRGLDYFDCTHLLVICGGAFVGLKEIVDKRKNIKTIGFNEYTEENKKEISLNDVSNVDLIEYGILPEVLGRIPFRSTLQDLTQTDLVNILKDSKNSILDEYKDLFSLFDIKVTFTKDALEAIAEEAVKRKTGARSLKSIVGKIMETYQYNIFTRQTKSLKITKMDILQALK